MNLARRVIRRKPSSSTTDVAATLVAGAAAVDAADVDRGRGFSEASGSGGREEGADGCDPRDEGCDCARELAVAPPLGGGCGGAANLCLAMRPASTASLS